MARKLHPMSGKGFILSAAGRAALPTESGAAGQIVGETKDKKCWRLVVKGSRSTRAIHKSYVDVLDMLPLEDRRRLFRRAFDVVRHNPSRTEERDTMLAALRTAQHDQKTIDQAQIIVGAR